ncbi:ACT domain-containing protein ACR9 [Raphanus sativus]|nr:ACT domain-containing protein ACR9 [Raphanus sativus]
MRGPGNEDAVVIEKGKKAGEPHVITVNCPDRTGLGCDICRIVLDFGLYIKKGDVTTDGVWCYIVLWVVPHYDSHTEMVTSQDPACICVPLLPNLLRTQFDVSSSSINSCLPVELLLPRPDGTLTWYYVTQVLTELELSIHSVKVTTTPDGRVLELFFVTDNLDLLHTKKRQDETLEQFRSVLGGSCISCELKLAGPEYEHHQKIPSLSPAVAEELFMSDQRTDEEDNRAQALSDDMMKMKNSSVTLSYGRFLPRTQGHRDIELFVQVKDEKKMLDPDKQNSLCSRLKAEMLHPLRVIVTNRGPDTELVVANPVELSGKGRPRVFYDVTLSLKVLGICVFSAEIRRYTSGDREWEVYIFLLDENCLFQFDSASVRNEIANKVRRTLMGW